MDTTFQGLRDFRLGFDPILMGRLSSALIEELMGGDV